MKKLNVKSYVGLNLCSILFFWNITRNRTLLTDNAKVLNCVSVHCSVCVIIEQCRGGFNGGAGTPLSKSGRYEAPPCALHPPKVLAPPPV